MRVLWVSTSPRPAVTSATKLIFRARRFVPGLYDYDYGCSYGYPYYAFNHSCYPPTYY
jgi:hypothetical protein